MTPEEEKALDEAIMNASLIQTEDIFNQRVAHVVECLVLGDQEVRREIREIAKGVINQFKFNLCQNIDTYGGAKSIKQIINDTYI